MQHQKSSSTWILGTIKMDSWYHKDTCSNKEISNVGLNTVTHIMNALNIGEKHTQTIEEQVSWQQNNSTVLTEKMSEQSGSQEGADYARGRMPECQNNRSYGKQPSSDTTDR